MLVRDRVVTHADPHGVGNPPTFIRQNGLTGIIQEVINTYGVPRYQEANPMIFTIVTFPFLFGVMFGDVGHGLLLLLAGLFCVQKAEELKSIPGYGQVIYDVRYLLASMGFFAFYAGLLYNDFFSLGLTLFESRYVEGPVGADHTQVELIPTFDAKNEIGDSGPYPFGLDPVWHGAVNELLFVNSLKMKCAVLLGVAQMALGIALAFSNAVFDRSLTDFFFVCIPQAIFLCMFFGYMDYCIIYKWTHVTPAPSIIGLMIDMGLGQTTKIELWEGQDQFHQTNLLIIGACVPWMLIPKPLILYAQNANKVRKAPEYTTMFDEEDEHDAHDEHHFDFSEICIHQVIETIEFVLGSVSHTASYLRLWALSLAHNQLSLVFLDKTILATMPIGGLSGGIAVYLSTGAFLGITFAILMGMDVLECFLHTLRLHWVEFQSKFYKADGYNFEPYSHRALLRAMA
jgi:V-type H+-transporting ATPase subunit a